MALGMYIDFFSEYPYKGLVYRTAVDDSKPLDEQVEGKVEGLPEREWLKPILQIHDELIIDTPEEETERVKALLSDCMSNVVKLRVPLKADVECGHSWFDTK